METDVLQVAAVADQTSKTPADANTKPSPSIVEEMDVNYEVKSAPEEDDEANITTESDHKPDVIVKQENVTKTEEQSLTVCVFMSLGS